MMDEQTEKLAGVIASCEIPTGRGNFWESRLLIRPLEEWEVSIAVRNLVRLALPEGGSVWVLVKGFELDRITSEGKLRAILIEWPPQLGMMLPVGTKVYVEEGHSIKGRTNDFQ